MMCVGVMTFQYSHRLFRPHAFRRNLPSVAAISSVLTRGWRAHPTASRFNSPRSFVSDTGSVSSRSIIFLHWQTYSRGYSPVMKVRPRRECRTIEGMARITISGGHGKVAMRLSRILAHQGHEVTSWIRSSAQSFSVHETGAKPIIVN